MGDHTYSYASAKCFNVTVSGEGFKIDVSFEEYSFNTIVEFGLIRKRIETCIDISKTQDYHVACYSLPYENKIIFNDEVHICHNYHIEAVMYHVSALNKNKKI